MVQALLWAELPGTRTMFASSVFSCFFFLRKSAWAHCTQLDKSGSFQQQHSLTTTYGPTQLVGFAALLWPS